jgi:hypothetical protein
MKTAKDLKNFLAFVPDDAPVFLDLIIPGPRYHIELKAMQYNSGRHKVILVSGPDHLFNLQNNSALGQDAGRSEKPAANPIP